MGGLAVGDVVVVAVAVGEAVGLGEGVPVALRSMPQVGLVIEGSRIAPTTALVQPASYTFAALPRATTSDQCCVTCGNVKACGCKVLHSCGSCCAGPCCPVEEITIEARYFPAVPLTVPGHSATDYSADDGRGRNIRHEMRAMVHA